MRTAIDMAAILSPISDDNPEGVDIRYSAIYDEIREARRSEDAIPDGEWQREGKSPEWERVITLSLDSLAEKSKDLLVATWLTEALTHRDGFEGIGTGMSILGGLLDKFWETVHPHLDGDDYDYRAAPFEFLNDRISATVRQIPLTDPRTTAGFSYLQWQESSEVANARGEVREHLLSDGKLTPEEFDSAVANSSPSFYRSLAGALSAAVARFAVLETLVDQKFGPHAPSLSMVGKALEECQRLVMKIAVEKKGLSDAFDEVAAESGGGEGAGVVAADSPGKAETGECRAGGSLFSGGDAPDESPVAGASGGAQETQLWNEAFSIMQSRGFKPALDLLLSVASSQSSERGRCRYRFLVAKLCLKAGRPELARPIVEQLHTTITELQLEKWECPFWIAEICEALYQCLISGEDSDEEASRARELFRKICTMDVTRALDSAK